MPIRILITGGTSDNEYNEWNGELSFTYTHVREMLTLGRNLTEVTLQTLFMMDSLQMTDEHREKIAEACGAAPETQIVITHGTDTMPETARLLQQRMDGRDKTIVLTGAMVPY